MKVVPSIVLENIPFCIGVFEEPANPVGLPNVYPMTIELDRNLSVLRLKDSPQLTELLNRSYKLGKEMGTPVSESALGIGYAEDLLSFIEKSQPALGRALEIGAGVGYVSHRLKAKGWSVDSIEPGSGYEAHWARYGLNVINDFFPNEAASGPYDLIVSYAVLEHISDPVAFLHSIAEHLSPGGKVVLAVPDCTAEILIGDPGMLIHEHYFYYTAQSLKRCLSAAGFTCDVEPAGYGRLLYASATVGTVNDVAPCHEETEFLSTFGQRCSAFVEAGRSAIAQSLERGSVGIFCPARALAIIPQIDGLRFFDDAPTLHGMYYPPFNSVIESRDVLLKDPVDELWIMSRTFGKRLKAQLTPLLPSTRIMLIEEFSV